MSLFGLRDHCVLVTAARGDQNAVHVRIIDSRDNNLGCRRLIPRSMARADEG